MVYTNGMTMAKVFMNGRSQAIRVPKEFRIPGKEVLLRKTADGFEVIARDPWELLREGCQELPDDFMANLVQPPLENRRWRK